MKNFNKKIYSLNMQTTASIKSNIPFEYFKMATNIANSLSKEYAAIGVLDLNDLTQEGYLALLISWHNIKWKIINNIKNKVEKQKAISKYLKKSIKGIISDRIKTNADGVKKPIKGIWDNKTKTSRTDVFGFLSILFPNWFDNNVLTLIEDEVYDYDYEQLGNYLEIWLDKHDPKYKENIKLRTIEMINQGLESEINNIKNPSKTILQAIGMNIDKDIEENINIKTMKLAKKQITWFKKEPRLKMIESEDESIIYESMMELINE